MENIDRMNLANEIDLTGQLKPGTPKNYYALISSIIVWLPALPSERLAACLTRIQEDAAHYIDSDSFTEYMKEQREVEAGNLTAPAFLQGIIENSIKKSLSQINDLEGSKSGLDTLIDQLQAEITELKADNSLLEKLATGYREEHEISKSTIEKLKLQLLTILQVFELCIHENSNHLTHAQRNAYAKVGLGILDKLFPDGLPGVPKKKADDCFF